MSVKALISLEEYLDTSYSPDREFVDGVVVERNVGERPHSLVQGNILFSLRQRYPHLFVWPEQRVRTIQNRSRVPDVCVTLADPMTDVFEVPPFLCVEILSKRDRPGEMKERLDEYRSIGGPNIWVVNPRRRKAFIYLGGQPEENEVDTLVTGAPEILLPLDEVFRGL